MSIKNWPLQLRPREKLFAAGASVLTDSELLAILIQTGVQGRNVVDLASDIISHFGGLRALFSSTQEQMHCISGVGPAKSAQLVAMVELNRRHLREHLSKGDALANPDCTRNYLISILRERKREIFLSLYLDNRHRVIADEELFKGTIDGAMVYPRIVAERALRHNAAAVIIAHNHPSGVAEPSRADEAITARLRDALALFDIRLLDHFIVGEGRPVSLAERGLV